MITLFSIDSDFGANKLNCLVSNKKNQGNTSSFIIKAYYNHPNILKTYRIMKPVIYKMEKGDQENK